MIKNKTTTAVFKSIVEDILVKEVSVLNCKLTDSVTFLDAREKRELLLKILSTAIQDGSHFFERYDQGEFPLLRQRTSIGSGPYERDIDSSSSSYDDK